MWGAWQEQAWLIGQEQRCPHPWPDPQAQQCPSHQPQGNRHWDPPLGENEAIRPGRTEATVDPVPKREAEARPAGPGQGRNVC